MELWACGYGGFTHELNLMCVLCLAICSKMELIDSGIDPEKQSLAIPSTNTLHIYINIHIYLAPAMTDWHYSRVMTILLEYLIKLGILVAPWGRYTELHRNVGNLNTCKSLGYKVSE